MPKTRPPYDEEFRREAVGLLARGERSLAALSSELGVSQETLRTWRRRAGVEAGKVEGLTRDEREELRRVTTATGAPERRSAGAQALAGLCQHYQLNRGEQLLSGWIDRRRLAE